MGAAPIHIGMQNFVAVVKAEKPGLMESRGLLTMTWMNHLLRISAPQRAPLSYQLHVFRAQPTGPSTLGSRIFHNMISSIRIISLRSKQGIGSLLSGTF